MNERNNLKHQEQSFINSNKSIENFTSLDLLKLIHKYQLYPVPPNLEISISNFFQPFLPQLQNYLRATTGQREFPIYNLAILSIKQNVVKNISFCDIVDEFATLKSCKTPLSFDLRT